MDRDRVTDLAASALDITVSDSVDFAVLEGKWRDLETRSDPSFFQCWTWTGCLVTERFPNPVLVEARQSGRTVALALFSRRGRTLYLGETGDPALDCIYIEYNGVLAESGREDVLTDACLRAARGPGPWKRRLVLSGIDARMVSSIGETNLIICNKSLTAPFVDLVGGIDRFLDNRSANTRQQLRRSDRFYAASGEIAITRAETPEDAQQFLTGLATLHQTSWAERGQPGAFARPFFARFHDALIARGLEREEIDLFHITAGSQTIGFLYNFRFRGCSLAYQSGFDYAGAGRHGKPGLTCHHQAIRYAIARGESRYDFLAGNDRYKRSLSDQTGTLCWVETGFRYAPRSLVRRARDLLSAARGVWAR
jgi:CelD/BcsL family acetyltransferase involved in cellulose biosynthesis